MGAATRPGSARVYAQSPQWLVQYMWISKSRGLVDDTTCVDVASERALRQPWPERAAPVVLRRRPQRTLLLFEKEWDAAGFGPLGENNEVAIVSRGFDLFRFPHNARLLTFDAWRFVDQVCDTWRGRIDAVVSNNEQFGALLAAVIAERLGLPGEDPAALSRAHHKFAARLAQHNVAPSATIRGEVLPLELSDPRVRDPQVLTEVLRALNWSLPTFVKPVKATFSVLARSVNSADELARHLRFGSFERLIIRKLVAPYAALASRYVTLPSDPTAMLLEEPADGHQINVDGYVHRGEVRVMGIVDAWMYPQQAAGARHFLRFSYPSIVQGELRRRVLDLTACIVSALGLRQCFFNCEFFLGAGGELKFIEINPRLASQFVHMYRDVDGFDVYRMLMALATGRDPAEVPRRRPLMGAAASLVWRRFDGTSGPPPADGALAWLAQRYPHARLAMYHKRGGALAREYKWLGSHRYAVVNVSAADGAALDHTFEQICARFGWPAEYPDRAVSFNAGPRAEAEQLRRSA